MKRNDLIGKRFGRLIVTDLANKKSGHLRWKCVCICGEKRIVFGNNLTRGHAVSCGCIRIEHGMSKTKTYKCWMHIKERCFNKRHPHYHHYGGRGIKICKRWKSFKNFYSDMGEIPHKMTIERINNNGNYEPSNCKWATRLEQSRNTRRAVHLTYNNQTKCLSQWARDIGISLQGFRNRIKRGLIGDKLFIR